MNTLSRFWAALSVLSFFCPYGSLERISLPLMQMSILVPGMPLTMATLPRSVVAATVGTPTDVIASAAIAAPTSSALSLRTWLLLPWSWPEGEATLDALTR